MADDIFDVLIVGGGVNGCGIAADASARGLRVALIEADDLASGTSSASSKLIHGGLRYLEHYEFRLVREALGEREILLAKAPHIIWPMRFILPRIDGMRPAWMLRAGLYLYDCLATRRMLQRSRYVDLRQDAAGAPLQGDYRDGFSYADCWVDDARLVVLNAVAARQAGARVMTRTPVADLRVDNGHWLATLSDGRSLAAKAVINAAGPWAERIAKLALGRSNAKAAPKLRLVKGSHIVVPRIRGADDAYIFQARDGRVVFALPFEQAFTLIGTTDEPFEGEPRGVVASHSEIEYLLGVANVMFRTPLQKSDVVHTFAGVRPLDDDGQKSASAVSRDYRLDLVAGDGPPLLNVIGGKITTYRRLAEHALLLLKPYFAHMGEPGDARAPLPGGEFGDLSFDAWLEQQTRSRPGFAPARLATLARRYGVRMDRIIDNAKTEADLGPDLGGGVTAREVAYLKHEEFAKTADDILWRRTKAGLHIPAARRAAARDAIDAALTRA